MSPDVLNVENLSVSFTHDGKDVRAVRGVSFAVGAGETVAIVGESGSGKSVTAKALMRLNAGNTHYDPKSKIMLNLPDGQVDVFSLKRDRDMRVVRGGVQIEPPGSPPHEPPVRWRAIQALTFRKMSAPMIQPAMMRAMSMRVSSADAIGATRRARHGAQSPVIGPVQAISSVAP